MTVKEAIKAAMKSKKITQTDLADRVGTGQSNLSMYIKSGTGMRLENLMKIVNACGFDVVLRDREDSSRMYVIGDESDSNTEAGVEKMVRRIVAEELAKQAPTPVPEKHKRELEPDL